MRHYIYKDIKIPQKEYNQLLTEYKQFHKDTSGLDLSFTTLEWDFKDYPTVPDTDGLQRPTHEFLKDMTKRVEDKLGKYATDHIKLLIHEDNWKSDQPGEGNGIWGTSWSYYYGNGNLCYDRWDKDNIANSFGTINHEDDHAYDSIIKTEIGVDINPLLGVKNYDAQTTHGGRDVKPAYHGYIRYKENADKLKILAPYLKSAYAKRLERHVEEIKGKQRTIISLLEKVIYLYRQKLNKKTTELK